MSFKGDITGYGKVFVSMKLISGDNSKTSGTLDGQARTILNGLSSIISSRLSFFPVPEIRENKSSNNFIVNLHINYDKRDCNS